MKIKMLLLFTLFTLISCKDDIQTVKIKGKYSIELSTGFTETKDLNEEASLQYQNLNDAMYVLVIDEPKSAMEVALKENSLYDTYDNNLDGYARVITDGMDSSIKVDSLPPFEERTINGLPSKTVSFEGVSSGYKVYWKLAFLEGKDTYYQVMVWTEAESRKKHEKEMTAIISSFKETIKSKN